MGRAALKPPSQFDDDTPLRLEIAAEIAFPSAGITASTLRAEIAKGNLQAFRIGGKTLTTLRELKAMTSKCRLNGREHDSGYDRSAAHQMAASGERPGSLRTAGSISPQDALRAKLRARSASSPTTSRRNTSRTGNGAT